MDETGIFEWIFKALATGFMGVVAWFIRVLIGDMRELKSQNSDHKIKHVEQGVKLADLRLHVSENYATKTDLNAARIELNDTVKRLHARIDDLPADIINLIHRGGNGK